MRSGKCGHLWPQISCPLPGGMGQRGPAAHWPAWWRQAPGALSVSSLSSFHAPCLQARFLSWSTTSMCLWTSTPREAHAAGRCPTPRPRATRAGGSGRAVGGARAPSPPPPCLHAPSMHAPPRAFDSYPFKSPDRALQRSHYVLPAFAPLLVFIIAPQHCAAAGRAAAPAGRRAPVLSVPRQARDSGAPIPTHPLLSLPPHLAC